MRANQKWKIVLIDDEAFNRQHLRGQRQRRRDGQRDPKKIFELFFSSKGAEGTGLGLFVTQKIVEQHGVRIKTRSIIGQGSMFRVSIPQRASAEGLRPECDTSALRAVLDAEK
jgi:hypothetical protein